jgi:hypothetical protein
MGDTTERACSDELVRAVDYSPQYGAVCPVCHHGYAPVYTTRPWEGNLRIRYHACVCGARFKSVERDMVCITQPKT